MSSVWFGSVFLNDGIQHKQNETQKTIHLKSCIRKNSLPMYPIRFIFLLLFSLPLFHTLFFSQYVFLLSFSDCSFFYQNCVSCFYLDLDDTNNGKKLLYTKQCANNSATFMTMQHWHIHHETGNSIQQPTHQHSAR